MSLGRINSDWSVSRTVHCTVLDLPGDKNNHRFSVCDLNVWIGVNAREVVARFARRHLWGLCTAVSVRSQCEVARFAKALHSNAVQSTTLFVNPRYPKPFRESYRAALLELNSSASFCAGSIFLSGLDNTTFVLASNVPS